MLDQPYRQEADIQTLNTHKKYCYACATVLDVRAELCPRCGVRQLAMPGSSLAPVPRVVIIGGEKSAAVAAVLAFFFGPLGMLYSTGIGALVMFFVNVVTIVATAGIGLVITIPISMIWAASAAQSHNARVQQQATAMLANPR